MSWKILYFWKKQSHKIFRYWAQTIRQFCWNQLIKISPPTRELAHILDDRLCAVTHYMPDRSCWNGSVWLCGYKGDTRGPAAARASVQTDTSDIIWGKELVYLSGVCGSSSTEPDVFVWLIIQRQAISNWKFTHSATQTSGDEGSWYTFLQSDPEWKEKDLDETLLLLLAIAQLSFQYCHNMVVVLSFSRLMRIIFKHLPVPLITAVEC